MAIDQRKERLSDEERLQEIGYLLAQGALRMLRDNGKSSSKFGLAPAGNFRLMESGGENSGGDDS